MIFIGKKRFQKFWFNRSFMLIDVTEVVLYGFVP